MKILAIEFSSDQRSVAVLENGLVVGSASEVATRETHAFALIEKSLFEAKIGREAIECIAIGTGPGSYTGIRSAIALAQGWQLALPVKLLGISSVECIATEARAREWFGNVNVVIDAQRNEVYLATYELGVSSFQLVEPLRLTTLDEAQARATRGEILVGPEVNRWFKDGRILSSDAAVLGQLAGRRQDFIAGDKLEPIYLREPNFVKAPPARILPSA